MELDLAKTVTPRPACQSTSSRSSHLSEGQSKLEKNLYRDFLKEMQGQSLLRSLKQFEGKLAESSGIAPEALQSFSPLL